MLGGFSPSVAQQGLVTPWDELIMGMAQGDVSTYALIKGLIARESGWSERIVGSDGISMGLMQIRFGSGGPYPGISQEALLDGSTSIVLGSRFLLGLLSRYGTAEAISAYNQGEGGLAKRGVSFNQDYVNDVQNYQVWYLNNLVAVPAEGDVSWAPQDQPVTESEGGIVEGSLAPAIGGAAGAAGLLFLGFVILILLRKR